eukprot:Tamp_18602.p1 GENE.Tamp_18602~~Tamp_18602.p1  ORF type:complete len:289 (-),score=44.28 Tamp_18602:161-1027(-)
MLVVHSASAARWPSGGVRRAGRGTRAARLVLLPVILASHVASAGHPAAVGAPGRVGARAWLGDGSRGPGGGGVLVRLRGGHGDGCSCGDKGEESELGLYDVINTAGCYSLNTEPDHDVKAVLRPQCETHDPSRTLLSSDDDQVLIFIAFSELVNLKTICFTGLGETRVKEMRAYASGTQHRPITDFDDAERAQPHAVFKIEPDAKEALVEAVVPTNCARHFQQIKGLTLFVVASHGADVTCIGWLGFRGQRTHMRLKTVLENTDYELRPKNNLHVNGLTQGPHQSTGF